MTVWRKLRLVTAIAVVLAGAFFFASPASADDSCVDAYVRITEPETASRSASTCYLTGDEWAVACASEHGRKHYGDADPSTPDDVEVWYGGEVCAPMDHDVTSNIPRPI